MNRLDLIEHQANSVNEDAVRNVEAPAPERLLLPAEIQAAMIAHALEDLPNEACGLIAFADERPAKLFRGTNVLGSPTRYRMAEAEVVRAIEEMDRRKWRMGAIYHSHPSSSALPSDTDLDEAAWPDALMVIVSLAGVEPELRAYRIDTAARTTRAVEIDVLEPAAAAEPNSSMLAAARRWLGGFASTGRSRSVSPIASGAEGHDVGITNERSVVGILGGMGPAATGDLYLKIVAETPADVDQDHIPVVIYADPRVPDRTDALLHDGVDPVPWLVRGALQLEKLGVSFIVIPCNTAHAFLDRVEAEIDTPILSMLETAAEAISGGYPGVRRVGLLATTGTIRAGIYQETLKRRGIEVIVPDEELLEHCVMPAIRAVKANNYHESVRSRLVEAAEYLEQRGAHAVLAACTEIPVVLSNDDIRLPLIDATEELAKATVREALERDVRSASPPLAVTGGRKRYGS